MRKLLPVAFVFVSAALAAGPKTVWDGVYTDAQATRGQAAYMTECSRCHGEDHRASGNVIVGAKFMQQWREDNLNNLYTILRNTMPRNAPRSLPEGTYLDIVSYMLKLNGFPAGKTDLAIADVADIMLVGKEGPSAVPDFALVTVTGCLGPITGDTSFVSAATEPVRTRQPQKSQGDEMATAFAKAAGTRKLSLMGVAYNAEGAEPSHRVEAKGFLIRLPEGDKLNVTSLQTSKTACTP